MFTVDLVANSLIDDYVKFVTIYEFGAAWNLQFTRDGNGRSWIHFQCGRVDNHSLTKHSKTSERQNNEGITDIDGVQVG